MVIKFKKLNEDAKLPVYNHDTDAGMDVYANEDITIPGLISSFFSFKNNPTRRVIKTGITLQGSDSKKKFYLQVKDTSGNALKKGVHALAGVVDMEYRGEIGIVLLNTNLAPIKIKKGDKIAQIIVFEIPKVEIVEVTEVTETQRGDKGFGSSGTITG